MVCNTHRNEFIRKTKKPHIVKKGKVTRIEIEKVEDLYLRCSIVPT